MKDSAPANVWACQAFQSSLWHSCSSSALPAALNVQGFQYTTHKQVTHIGYVTYQSIKWMSDSLNVQNNCAECRLILVKRLLSSSHDK